MRMVVVGGVAGGMSFAARARRLAEDAEIIVLERGDYVSFANCGLPYHVGGEIPDRADLLLHTPASLAASLNLDVRTGHEVTGIDRAARRVSVRQTAGGRGYELDYDALVLATGAAPARPPIPGLDLPQVRTLRTVPDADAVNDLIEAGARRAVVLGAGFIGLEAVEALRHRGLQVDLVEREAQVLPPLDPELAGLLAGELRAHQVGVHLGVAASGVRPARPGTGHAVEVGLADGRVLAADVVLLSVGVRPERALARQAGLKLGTGGAVRVDATMRTSDRHIWAVGDAVEVVDAVTGAPSVVPLAGPANRQGRIAADAVLGRAVAAPPAMGTAIVRVFGLTAAVTGASGAALRRAGLPHHAVHLHPGDHAGYYPGAGQIHLKLTFAGDGRLLGGQAVGAAGVDKRIDVLATALRAGMTVDDLADLELAYAPPFGSAKDPVNMAGFLAQNVLHGDVRLWYPEELPALAEAGALLLDVRSAAEYRAGHLPGAVNVPHTQLREELDEIRALAAGAPVRVYCATGFRSYLAHRVLTQAGLDSATLSGGLTTLRAARPDAPLTTAEPVTA
ncbi:MAG: FAD-dependent oxidoreductase [Micromonosporaceae bacterium]|nr:FAD-dependent oxidoreductase [Micromonosporaceae bacterium]